jgi:hypothetical protein
MNNRPAKEPARTTPKSSGSPPTTGHLSDAVRADLGKLSPEQRAEILRVADSK